MKRIILILLLSILYRIDNAGAQGWSVNSADYTYDMTVTAVLNINCTELDNPSNKLGAFINGEVRGVAISSTVVNNRYVAMLTVYSNVASGETVSFKIYKAATAEIVDVAATIQFQDDAVYGTPSSPYAVKTNYEPTAISLSSTSVLEGNSSVLIGTLSATDPDATDTHTYSLVSGAGSTDNSAFSITGNQLFANGVLDYETKTSYNIRIKASDANGCSKEEVFTITVLNANDAPTDIALSNNRVNENLPATTLIGVFTTTDQDQNETFTYSLVTGTGDTDNSSFAVQGDKLVLNSMLDYESKANYSVRIRSTDKLGAFFEKVFTIELNDVNDKPTGITISADAVTENNKVGQTIGTFTTQDQDAGETFTYALKDVPGNNNNKFFIVGNQLKASVIFDYEQVDEYYIYVSTFDSHGAEFYTLLVISVLDGNDSPTDITLSSSSISENMPVGTFIGKFYTTDIDAGQTHIYSLINGAGSADNASFFVRNDSLFSNGVFDIDVKGQYSIRVQTDDQNGATYSKPFDIFIKDINKAPTDIYIDNFIVEEDVPLGTVIGKLSAADADPGDGHTFKLVAGTGDTDNAFFTIVSGQLKSNTLFDSETKDTYSIRVEANDGFGGTFQKQLTIQVANGNDAPTDITLVTSSIKENKAPGSTVTKINTVDQDITDTHTYTFENVQGNENSNFLIYGNELRTNIKFDFETKSQYFIAIRSTDPFGKSIVKQFFISVLDSNDAPTDLIISNTEINENRPVGEVIGSFTTTDIDAVDSHSYSLVSGLGSDDNSYFTISGSNLVSAAVFDYNVKNTFAILVQTEDAAGAIYKKSFIIKVKDVNAAPTQISLSATDIDENKPVGSVIAILSTVDEDAGDLFTYKLVSGTGSADNSKFTITNNQLSTTAIFNYEKKSSYSIRLQTTDSGGNTFEQVFEISVNDINEAPVAYDDLLVVSEDAATGTIIGTVKATDVDAAQSLTYYLTDNTSSTISNLFKVNVLTGEVSLLSNKLDYEKVKSYAIAVVVYDDGDPSLSDTSYITIKVEDVVENNITSIDYISPNGDGRNDYWIIENVSLYADFKVMIFDANGILVFKVDSNYDNSWNGTHNGNDLPVGAYYYVVESNTDGSKVFKGTITLVR